MNPLLAAIAILGGCVMVVTILHWVVTALREGALAEARIREMEDEIALAAKRNAELLKERTVEDVARSADDGEF